MKIALRAFWGYRSMPKDEKRASRPLGGRLRGAVSLRRLLKRVRERAGRDFLEGALIGFVFGGLWMLLRW